MKCSVVEVRAATFQGHVHIRWPRSYNRSNRPGFGSEGEGWM